jgi:hypothetical protein
MSEPKELYNVAKAIADVAALDRSKPSVVFAEEMGKTVAEYLRSHFDSSELQIVCDALIVASASVYKLVAEIRRRHQEITPEGTLNLLVFAAYHAAPGER